MAFFLATYVGRDPNVSTYLAHDARAEGDGRRAGMRPARRGFDVNNEATGDNFRYGAA